MTYEDTNNVISSPESVDGASRYGSPDGQITDLFGLEVVLVSHGPVPGIGRGETTKDISGLCGSDSSKLSVPQLSSVSKSQVATSLDERTCKGCGQRKPLKQFRPHNGNGRRWTCRVCENAWVRTTKPWNSDTKKKYQKGVRLNKRGLALTSDAKRRAKTKGIPFDLDWRDIQKRIDKGACEVSGIRFDLMTPKAWNAPSLDQIVPGKGYTKTNTRVVLHAVNSMVGTWGLDVALTIVAEIRKRK